MLTFLFFEDIYIRIIVFKKMEKIKDFKPTPQWMAEKYSEMNGELFGGKLGECDFGIFTTGRGSEGSVLGWFKIGEKNIRVVRRTRRMFYDGWEKIYIDRGNFCKICKPRIELNGNYNGTENGFLATLVHEMCHYYNYMYGFCPKQGHGREFKEIAYIVSNRSNGRFSVQRIATAEQMSELELNDEMKAKKERRAANKLANTTALVVYKKNGDVRLILTRIEKLIYEIYNLESNKDDVVKIFRSNDKDLIEYLFSRGYRSLMRTYRFWNVRANLDVLQKIDNAEGKDIYENNKLSASVKTTSKPTQNLSIHHPKRVFSIKTSNGTFECDATAYATLFKALRERFPNMSDAAIQKIMNNPSNYKVMENKRTTKEIIREVIDELMRNEFRGADNFDDSVEIDPNMNLGMISPLEIK